jgi:hypothetical protein
MFNAKDCYIYMLLWQDTIMMKKDGPIKTFLLSLVDIVYINSAILFYV